MHTRFYSKSVRSCCGYEACYSSKMGATSYCGSINKVRQTLLNLICILKSVTETPAFAWLSTCQTFLSDLTTHIDNLSAQLAQSKLLKDEERCLPLRYCSILSLTSLALMSHTLSKNQSWTAASAVEFRGKCISAMNRIFTLVGELNPFDFQYLDSFLAVSDD